MSNPAVHSYQHRHIASIKDVTETLLSQIEEFFVSYNLERGKKFKVISANGPKKAIKMLKAGMRAHEKENRR